MKPVISSPVEAAQPSPRGQKEAKPLPAVQPDPTPPDNIDNRDEYQAIPIYCVAKLSPKNIVPAVRVNRSSTRSGVLPLSRDAFGSVWDSQEVMQHWIEMPVDEGWANAEEEFRATIDYPHEILSATLRVLQTGQFQDGTPVSLSRWPFLAKFDVNRIGIKATCTSCTQTHWISPERYIHSLPPYRDSVVLT